MTPDELQERVDTLEEENKDLKDRVKTLEKAMEEAIDSLRWPL